MNGPLTILCLSGDNDVALDHQVLQRRPFCQEQLRKRERADTRLPETLECLGVLTPRVDEDIKARTTLNVHIFNEIENDVALILDKECEGDDKTLVICFQRTIRPVRNCDAPAGTKQFWLYASGQARLQANPEAPGGQLRLPCVRGEL